MSTVLQSSRFRRTFCAAVLVGCVVSAGVGSVAFAHENAEGVVRERMDMMKKMRDAMKVLRPLMDADQVDQAQALPPAQIIADLSAKVADHFPKGSLGGDSDALPDIWDDWDDFVDDAKTGTDRANTLVAAIKTGSGEKSLRAYAHVAKACKDCHDDFKQKR